MTIAELAMTIAQAIELYPSQQYSADMLTTLQQAPLTEVVAELQNFLCNESTVNASLHVLACSAVQRESITDEQVALLVQFFVEKIAIDTFASATLSSLASFLRDLSAGQAVEQQEKQRHRVCSPDVFRVLMDGVLCRLATHRLPLPARRGRFDVLYYMLNTNTLSRCHTNDLSVILEVIDGEGDPELVLRVFQIHHLLYTAVPEAVFAEVRMDYFDSVSSYFPVAFAQPVGCKVTKKDLKRELVACLAHPVYHDMSIPFVLDKMSSPSNITKQDALHVLTSCVTSYGSTCAREHLHSMVHTLRNEFIKLTTIYLAGSSGVSSSRNATSPSPTRNHSVVDSCLSSILNLLQKMSQVTLTTAHTPAVVLELFAPITEGAVASMSSPDTQVASAYATMLYHILTASWSVSITVGGYVFAMLSSRNSSDPAESNNSANSCFSRSAALLAHEKSQACLFQLFAALNTGLVVSVDKQCELVQQVGETTSPTVTASTAIIHFVHSDSEACVDAVKQMDSLSVRAQQRLQAALQPARDAVLVMAHRVVENWLRCSPEANDSEVHCHALLCAVEFLVSLLKLSHRLPNFLHEQYVQEILDGLVYAALLPRTNVARVGHRIASLLRDYALLDEKCVMVAVQRQLKQPLSAFGLGINRAHVTYMLDMLEHLVCSFGTMSMFVLTQYFLSATDSATLPDITCVNDESALVSLDAVHPSGNDSDCNTDRHDDDSQEEHDGSNGWLCTDATRAQRAHTAYRILSTTPLSLTIRQVKHLVHAVLALTSTTAHTATDENNTELVADCSAETKEARDEEESTALDYLGCCCFIYTYTTNAVRDEIFGELMCQYGYTAPVKKGHVCNLSNRKQVIWLLAALLSSYPNDSSESELCTLSDEHGCRNVGEADEEASRHDERISQLYVDFVRLCACRRSEDRRVGFLGVTGLVCRGVVSPSRVFADATVQPDLLGPSDIDAEHNKSGVSVRIDPDGASLVSHVIACVAALWGSKMLLRATSSKGTFTDATKSDTTNLTSTTQKALDHVSVRAGLLQLLSAAATASLRGNEQVGEQLLLALAEQPFVRWCNDTHPDDVQDKENTQAYANYVETTYFLLEDYLACVTSRDAVCNTILRSTFYWRGLCCLLPYAPQHILTQTLLHVVAAHVLRAVRCDILVAEHQRGGMTVPATAVVTPAMLIHVLGCLLERCSEPQQLMFIVAVMRESSTSPCNRIINNAQEEGAHGECVRSVAEHAHCAVSEDAPLLHAVLCSLHAPSWSARCASLQLLTTYARGLDAMADAAQDNAQSISDRKSDCNEENNDRQDLSRDVAPIKEVVLRATLLCLSDKKRRVRQAAAQCRERWFKLR